MHPLSLTAALALPSLVLAQGTLDFSSCGGQPGSTAQYSVTGGAASAACLVLTSGQRANIPLNNFDGVDTRRLGVGLELPQFHIYTKLDAKGAWSLAIKVPNQASLLGLNLYHQAATYPGKSTLVDGLSDVLVTQLGKSGATAQASLPGVRMMASGIPLGAGRYLIAGGGSGTPLWQAAVDSSLVYDMGTRKVTAGPTMAGARSVHGQCRLPDGRYLLTGGVDKSNAPLKTCEIYDPKTNKFSAVASMAGVRMGHTCTLLSTGKVLVTGGITNTSNQTNALTSATRNTELYDPKTNTWSAGPLLSTYRSFHAAVPLSNGQVLLPGGISWRNLFFIKLPQVSSTCDIYDPKTNRMSRTGSLRTKRAMYGAVTLADGSVLAVGGISGTFDQSNAGVSLASCEIYSPSTGSWSTTGAMANKRSLPAALVLVDGQVMAMGGATGSLWVPAVTDTTEIFDPKSKTWKASHKLTMSRAGTLAIRMPNCVIGLFGGATGRGANATATTELLWQ